MALSTVRPTAKAYRTTPAPLGGGADGTATDENSLVMLTQASALTIMVIMDRERLSKAVGKAVRKTPTSIRGLANRVGVSHVMLLQIRDGKRPAPRALAERIAVELEGCQDELAELSREIREALEDDSQLRGY